MMDKVRNWWYESNSRKSTGGMIFMIIAGVVFAGVLIFVGYSMMQRSASIDPAAALSMCKDAIALI